MLLAGSSSRETSAILLALCIAAAALGGEPGQAPPTVSAEEASPGIGPCCLRDRIADEGVVVALGITHIYQQNVHGGISTSRRRGRHSGSYDLEFELDLERLLGIESAILFASVEGDWNRGIDEPSVGSLFGVNADAYMDRAADVTQLYYEQELMDGRLRFRLGKLDITGGFECHNCPVAFDGNAFANDETSQFLNGSLVNNPSIPFPDYGIGAVVHCEPLDRFYVSAGVADAQADRRETGLNTAFHDEDYFVTFFETGVTPEIASPNGPLQGAYRVGLWYDPQPKDYLNGEAKRKRDDVGLYASFDQVMWKETDQEDDAQGLGAFARWGAADSDVNEIKAFWSAGLQYKGLIPTRDDDVAALALGQGRLSRKAGFDENHETALELYYNARLTPWLNITPGLQYIANPGGAAKSDAVVASLRLQMPF